MVSGAKAAKSGAKVAKQKIEEKQAQRDAEKISKMGGLAAQLTNSFDNILFEIKTRPYAEQEQIYKGLLKLMNQQRKLVKARRDLATKLKGSVDKPVVNESRKAAEEHSIVRGNEEEDQKQKQLPKESELPIPEPQLPEINIANTNVNNDNEQQLKSNPQIITAAAKKSSEYIVNEGSSSSSSIKVTTTNEDPSTEISPKKEESKSSSS